MLVAFLLSLRCPYYADRCLTIVLSKFEIWFALGVTVLPCHWRLVAVGVLLVVSALAVTEMLAGTQLQEDRRLAVARVRAEARPGDHLSVVGAEHIPVSTYYLEDTFSLGMGLPGSSSAGQARFLYCVPVESNHLPVEPARFELSTQADATVGTWLTEHARQVRGRGEYPGLALSLSGESLRG